MTNKYHYCLHNSHFNRKLIK